MVLFDLCRQRLDTNCSLWLVLADFKKAYPYVRRLDLLTLLNKVTQLRGSTLSLLEKILQVDMVVVSQSCSRTVLSVSNGLLEGGHVGPLAYLLLPDSLPKFLGAHNCGVASKPWVPNAWRDHAWKSNGCPDDTLTHDILRCLRLSLPLRSVSNLARDIHVEGSA